MKLCFVVADITFKGGIERVTVNLANELVKENNITIVSYFKTNEKINYDLDNKIQIEYISNKKYDGKPSSIKRLIKFLRLEYFIINFFKKKEYDYIIAQGMPVAFLMFFLNFTQKIIVCEHVHYNYYNSFFKFLRNILYKYYFKIIVLTEKDKYYFDRYLKNVECIPNFIPYVSQKFSVLNNKILISVGRLEKQKGYDILIEVCSKFLHKYPDWKLKIFGEGNLKNELKKQILNYKLENQILLMGTTNQIEREYLKSDIYIMSSRFEGFPMVLLEAGNYGLPIISFDCPSGPSDVIENGISGFLIKNFDKNEMQNKIEELIKNENLKKEMGKNIKERVKKFHKNEILKKWNNLFYNV